MADTLDPTVLTAENNGDDRELPYSLQLELVVQDRDVVRALLEHAEGDARNRFALDALRIGVLSIRHVTGQVHADLIQREVCAMQQTLQQHQDKVQAQLSATLREYFDPKDGRFSHRVQGLVSEDGELAQLIRGFIDGENCLFARTLVAHVGRDSPLMKQLDPDQSKGLLATLRDTVNQQLNQQRDQVLREFSLDNSDGALSRFIRELTTKHGNLTNDLRNRIDTIVKEFSLDEPNSALSRLVNKVSSAQETISNEFSLDNKESGLARLKDELMVVLAKQTESNNKFQQEVKGALRELSARREEQARSTLHGGTFQSAVFELLHRLAEQRGDIADFTADIVGAIKNRKWGDVVVTLGQDSPSPGTCIVFEAKEKEGYSLKSALEEIENARKNRLAQIGVFVFSKKTAPAEVSPLARYGNDVVTVWDADDALSDVNLFAAFELARAIAFHCRRQSEGGTADFEAIEKCMLAIEKHVNNMDDVRTSANTIRSASDTILDRVRIDQKELLEQVAALRKHMSELQATLAGKA